MSAYWRASGFSYIKYSNVCAQALRNCLKGELKVASERRSFQAGRIAIWENGKPGEQVQTNLQQVAEDKYVFEIPQPQLVRHIVVFMLGTIPFPDGYAGAVYFHWPNKEWQLLGYLANDKPSAIFQLSNTTNDLGLSGEPATLGISIEPVAQVLQQVELKKGQANGQALVLSGSQGASRVMNLAQKLVTHLYNYLSSFGTGQPQGPVWGMNQLTDNHFVPMKSLLQWHGVIQSKISKDPFFFEKDVD